MTTLLHWNDDEGEQGWAGMLDVSHHVARDSRICGGKAVIAGTRIPVYMLVDMYDDGRMSAEDVLMQYPRLTLEAFYDALSYADKYKHRIDKDREANRLGLELAM